MSKLFQNKQACTGCHSCYNRCPVGAISMDPDVEGFLYPRIDPKKCIQCDLCLRVCPIYKEPSVSKKEPEAFAAVCNSEELRTSSSSGGIFSLLANEILSRGGMVFGAIQTADCKAVVHAGATTELEQQKQRGSKYLQSRIGTTYREAEAFLEKGGTVLFSGTPCQIAGLYAFLKKDYERLYTQDLICHGAPSPLVWKKYAEEMEQQVGETLQTVSFRNKERGWKNFSLKLTFSDQSNRSASLMEDFYLKGFMSDLFLRPSCYQCKYKSMYRQADITLADFWGVEHLHPELDDDRGVSLVFTHSKKGTELLEAVRHAMNLVSTNASEAIQYNPAMIQSAHCPERRNAFMAHLPKESYKKLYAIFLRPPFLKRIKKRIRQILKHVR